VSTVLRVPSRIESIIVVTSRYHRLAFHFDAAMIRSANVVGEAEVLTHVSTHAWAN
jgi:hypothetical protein